MKKALADAQRECVERQRELDAKAQEILKMQEALQHERMEYVNIGAFDLLVFLCCSGNACGST